MGYKKHGGTRAALRELDRLLASTATPNGQAEVTPPSRKARFDLTSMSIEQLRVLAAGKNKRLVRRAKAELRIRKQTEAANDAVRESTAKRKRRQRRADETRQLQQLAAKLQRRIRHRNAGLKEIDELLTTILARQDELVRKNIADEEELEAVLQTLNRGLASVVVLSSQDEEAS